MKIKELQERYGLKTRQSIYDWIKAANLTLPKDERGHAYATPEQIETLDQLSEHLKSGGTLGTFTPLSSPQIYTSIDSQIDTSEASTVYSAIDTVNLAEDSPMVMLERLVGAIAANIQPRSPLWFHEELEKASKQGWILSTSEVESLIGVKPKGEIFHRGGWEFVRAGKIGNQGAWKVNKL
ncbi:MerR family transcriptional regulator [Planktothrix mougeotii]|uniref:MerR family transcriptional regulator n=1 Tax=Planktothrix mougeotii LEGE 06226 TaxID=1828728 RepID=A0ABR9UEK0_9CYAN|nr:MerR family transcriptional regulator [Planktothrix mougeotii]MBE9144888.1 MerR family transcriptional regulator [Planktothrix mougeotii LEGE 06226]